MLRATGALSRVVSARAAVSRSNALPSTQLLAPMVLPSSLDQRRTFIPAPVIRLIIQLGMSAAGVITRAFVSAYQEAAQSTQQGVAAARGRGKMTEAEAVMILNVEEPWTPEKVQQQYEKYFAANDPEKGGSFYIQSKVYRAKECLDATWVERMQQGKESAR